MDIFQNSQWDLWGSTIGAFLLMQAITPFVILLARRMEWVSYPRKDRWHQKSTALMGGIAIYASATITLLIFSPHLIWSPIWGGASFMFLVGFIDDLKNIKPSTKFIAQVIGTSVLIYSGLQFAANWPIWLSLPLTFLWVIGITNALNLLDNMDGLAGGISGIASGIIALFLILLNNPNGAIAPLVICGASFGFLTFNFKPAHIFMGDCGSLFLGYFISAITLTAQTRFSSAGIFFVLLIPISVMVVPIFDTTLVTVARLLSKRPISQGGRDHSSHRLVFLGLSEPKAVLTLYIISLLFGILALLLYFSTTVSAIIYLFILAFLGIGLIFLGIYLGTLNVYTSKPNLADKIHSRAQTHSIVTHWGLLAAIITDVLFILVSFTFAYYLHFNGVVSLQQTQWITRVLPVIVILKLLVFHQFGIYRLTWQFTGFRETLRIASASTAVSIFASFAFWSITGGETFLWEVFMVDWLCTTLAIVGIRLAFRTPLLQMMINRK